MRTFKEIDEKRKMFDLDIDEVFAMQEIRSKNIEF